ncbi:hypothetical protein CBR_g49438 [Chara braunii]|uniref:Uncharacterized protein n=1 Tax=Chara braunii TaxID=69332 RepID=A0A388M537_CHABU|nr:hypothetical protein CBR_g49438 [Chara braunii]|eukprot:GBG89650.1 hypothetical protein CBR_g49438 [Chara braunii]
MRGHRAMVQTTWGVVCAKLFRGDPNQITGADGTWQATPVGLLLHADLSRLYVRVGLSQQFPVLPDGSGGSAASMSDVCRRRRSTEIRLVTVDSTGLEAHASATTRSLACTDNVRRTNGSSKAIMDHGVVHGAEQRLQDSMGDRSAQAMEQSPQHRERVEQGAEQRAERPGVRQIVVQTVDQRVDEVVQDLTGQRVEERVDHSADRRLDERAHPSDMEGIRPMVVQTAEQRVGVGLAAMVEQRVEQRVHPCAALGADPRVEQRVEQRVEVRVDVSVEHHVDQGRSDITRERVGERIDESVIGDESGVMVEERIEDRDREPPQESSARDIALTGASFYGIPPLPPPQERASKGVMGGVNHGSSQATQGGGHSLLLTSCVPSTSLAGIPPRPEPGAIHSRHSSTLSGASSLPTSVRPSSSRMICTAMRSPLGMPPLLARRPSAIRDNVKTSRAGRKKRQREDDRGEDPPPARLRAGTGRARGRPRGSGRGRGKQQQSWALSALGDADAETADLGEGIATGGGVSGGIHTRSQVAGRERQKTSSHVVDDDPDGDDHGNTSDEMSGNDYADETRQRGQAEGGDDNNSDGTGEMAD